ncbi:MAG: NAD(P)H-hydrate dehydratase [Bacteroidales bacterium]|nr:NAD(P)H-hydrate dehydratase [Bacteroidales bacterium]
MERKSANIETLTSDYIRSLMRRRKADTHKGDYGHAMLIGGSYGMMGAAVLASRACMRSGAGLLTAHIPVCGYQIMQTTVPEVMCSVDSSHSFFSATPPLDKYDALAIGPGLGMHQDTVRAIEVLLRSKPANLIVDADAINILAKNRELLRLLPEGTIFTPHKMEFSRLIGEEVTEANKRQLQSDFSRKYSAVVVLKGYGTTITSPDGRLFVNPTGNPGMATAGSGDVLTGVLLALLAQGYPLAEAACIGVYLHGLAGDIAADEIGEISLMSGDLIEYLPDAFREMISAV